MWITLAYFQIWEYQQSSLSTYLSAAPLGRRFLCQQTGPLRKERHTVHPYPVVTHPTHTSIADCAYSSLFPELPHARWHAAIGGDNGKSAISCMADCSDGVPELDSGTFHVRIDCPELPKLQRGETLKNATNEAECPFAERGALKSLRFLRRPFNVWNHHSFLTNLKRNSVIPGDERVLNRLLYI